MPEELKDKNIDNERLGKICRYRQGEQCCKYILYLSDFNDFFCVKNISHLRQKLDDVTMAAKGDNCAGL